MTGCCLLASLNFLLNIIYTSIKIRSEFSLLVQKALHFFETVIPSNPRSPADLSRSVTVRIFMEYNLTNCWPSLLALLTSLYSANAWSCQWQENKYIYIFFKFRSFRPCLPTVIRYFAFVAETFPRNYFQLDFLTSDGRRI